MDPAPIPAKMPSAPSAVIQAAAGIPGGTSAPAYPHRQPYRPGVRSR
jgi:hypothetical protein